jgi:hypothetical protein
MDFLGFSKGRNDFLEIKYVSPQNPLATPDPPDPDRLRPFVRPGGHWPPHGIPRWVVRLGPEWAGVWPGRRVAGRTGSERIGCGHSRMWQHVHRAAPCCFEGGPKVFDGKLLRVTAAGRDLAGGEVPLHRLVSPR